MEKRTRPTRSSTHALEDGNVRPVSAARAVLGKRMAGPECHSLVDFELQSPPRPT